jgi:hypothetical protein
VIASVTRIIASGDPISRIVGSLSGMQLLVFCVNCHSFINKLSQVFSFIWICRYTWVCDE